MSYLHKTHVPSSLLAQLVPAAETLYSQKFATSGLQPPRFAPNPASDNNSKAKQQRNTEDLAWLMAISPAGVRLAGSLQSRFCLAFSGPA